MQIFTSSVELEEYSDDDDRLRRIVELNVREQCLNLYRNPIVQHSQMKNGNFPRIHGMVYDIHDGLLKELKVNMCSLYHFKYLHNGI